MRAGRSAWGERLSLATGSRLASGLIRLLRTLMRWRYVNQESVVDLHRAGRPYIHAFYHDQLLMMTYSYVGRRYGRRLVVLSSLHRDGEYVARTLERFGHLMVRGSTGRGGAAGLRDIIRHLRAGRDAAIATDGPRGPRHKVQMGVIEAARIGGAPVVPVAFAASKKRTLRSWDQFQIPWPFSVGVFVYGSPVVVPADGDRALMETARRRLEEALDGLAERAERLSRGESETLPLGVSRT